MCFPSTKFRFAVNKSNEEVLLAGSIYAPAVEAMRLLFSLAASLFALYSDIAGAGVAASRRSRDADESDRSFRSLYVRDRTNPERILTLRDIQSITNSLGYGRTRLKLILTIKKIFDS